jgi:hypothetical protein
MAGRRPSPQQPPPAKREKPVAAKAFEKCAYIFGKKNIF